MVKVPAHAGFICCFICKPDRFEQRSMAIVDCDGDLRSKRIFCIEHFESFAMLSFSRSAVPHCVQKCYQFGPVDGVERALLIWMLLETCLCSLYTAVPVTRLTCGISFLLRYLVSAKFEFNFVKILAELFAYWLLFR